MNVEGRGNLIVCENLVNLKGVLPLLSNIKLDFVRSVFEVKDSTDGNFRDRIV